MASRGQQSGSCSDTPGSQNPAATGSEGEEDEAADPPSGGFSEAAHAAVRCMGRAMPFPRTQGAVAEFGKALQVVASHLKSPMKLSAGFFCAAVGILLVGFSKSPSCREFKLLKASPTSDRSRSAAIVTQWALTYVRQRNKHDNVLELLDNAATTTPTTRAVILRAFEPLKNPSAILSELGVVVSVLIGELKSAGRRGASNSTSGATARLISSASRQPPLLTRHLTESLPQDPPIICTDSGAGGARPVVGAEAATIEGPDLDPASGIPKRTSSGDTASEVTVVTGSADAIETSTAGSPEVEQDGTRLDKDMEDNEKGCGRKTPGVAGGTPPARTAEARRVPFPRRFCRPPAVPRPVFGPLGAFIPSGVFNPSDPPRSQFHGGASPTHQRWADLFSPGEDMQPPSSVFVVAEESKADAEARSMDDFQVFYEHSTHQPPVDPNRVRASMGKGTEDATHESSGPLHDRFAAGCEYVQWREAVGEAGPRVEEAADRLTREKIALEGRLEVTEKRLEQVLRDLEESQDLVAVLLAERSFELDKVVVPEVSVPRSSAANTSSWAPFSVDAIPTEELILHRRPASRPGAWVEPASSQDPADGAGQHHLASGLPSAEWIPIAEVVNSCSFPSSRILPHTDSLARSSSDSTSSGENLEDGIADVMQPAGPLRPDPPRDGCYASSIPSLASGFSSPREDLEDGIADVMQPTGPLRPDPPRDGCYASSIPSLSSGFSSSGEDLGDGISDVMQPAGSLRPEPPRDGCSASSIPSISSGFSSSGEDLEDGIPDVMKPTGPFRPEPPRDGCYASSIPSLSSAFSSRGEDLGDGISDVMQPTRPLRPEPPRDGCNASSIPSLSSGFSSSGEDLGDGIADVMQPAGSLRPEPPRDGCYASSIPSLSSGFSSPREDLDDGIADVMQPTEPFRPEPPRDGCYASSIPSVSSVFSSSGEDVEDGIADAMQPAGPLRPEPPRDGCYASSIPSLSTGFDSPRVAESDGGIASSSVSDLDSATGGQDTDFVTWHGLVIWSSDDSDPLTSPPSLGHAPLRLGVESLSSDDSASNDSNSDYSSSDDSDTEADTDELSSPSDSLSDTDSAPYEPSPPVMDNSDAETYQPPRRHGPRPQPRRPEPPPRPLPRWIAQMNLNPEGRIFRHFRSYELRAYMMLRSLLHPDRARGFRLGVEVEDRMAIVIVELDRAREEAEMGSQEFMVQGPHTRALVEEIESYA